MVIKKNIHKKIFHTLTLTFLSWSSFLYGNGSDLHVNRRRHNHHDSLWLSTSGGNVTNCISFKRNLKQYFVPTGLIGSYFLWCKAWELPSNYGTISFSAIATNDIHVGVSIVNPWNVRSTGDFYARLVNSSNLYEFVIGGWGNEQSALRKGSQAEPVLAVPRGIPTDPHTGQAVNLLVRYKIIFYRRKKDHKNVIAVYYRVHDKRNNKWTKLMSYEDPSLLRSRGKRWFSFSTWDSSIFYTNIKASASTKLP